MEAKAGLTAADMAAGVAAFAKTAADANMRSRRPRYHRQQQRHKRHAAELRIDVGVIETSSENQSWVFQQTTCIHTFSTRERTHSRANGTRSGGSYGAPTTTSCRPARRRRRLSVQLPKQMLLMPAHLTGGVKRPCRIRRRHRQGRW